MFITFTGLVRETWRGGGIRLSLDTEVLSSNINQLMTGPKGTVSFVLGLDKFCS